ncbi:PEP-CTERM sorting domain-containing protein [Pontiella sp.]|uniref:PEP-CTERM sorting domain-containing protein n=1 Tax=Pontiella sp. TaxID=2837462 RepID=UPI00356AF538
MNPKFKKFIIVGLFILCPIAKAGLILTQGQSYEFEFSSISLYAFDPDNLYGDPPVAISNQQAHADFQLGSNQLDPGESLILSLFENNEAEPVIRSSSFSATRHSFSGGGLYLGDLSYIPWQDKQGILRIDVLSGTVEIDSFKTATVIDNQYYEQTYAIPEPNSVGLIIIGTGILYLRRKRFSKSGKEERLTPSPHTTNHVDLTR